MGVLLPLANWGWSVYALSLHTLPQIPPGLGSWSLTSSLPHPGRMTPSPRMSRSRWLGAWACPGPWNFPGLAGWDRRKMDLLAKALILPLPPRLRHSGCRGDQSKVLTA